MSSSSVVHRGVFGLREWYSRFLLLSCLLCPFPFSYSQQATSVPKGATVSGTVVTREGEPLVGAHVILRGTPFGTATSVEGTFRISEVPAGSYTIDVSFIACKKCSRTVRIEEGKNLVQDFVLDQESFQIGEMQVVGERPLVSHTPETRTTISSAEIEHLQASSIGDVLDVVPGIQKTANPGLGKNIQIGVRGALEDPLTAFGTKVLVDGIPLSNNANLQFEKWTAAKTGTTTMGAGADLRMIPADNLDHIEVIRGLPSVRYGELTSGLINIRTKTGAQPNRLKVKSNPDTREGNLGGGFEWGDAAWSYNVNAAQSERDIRKTGDEYTRLTGQVVASTSHLDKALTLTNKLFGQKIFDEEKPQNDANRIHNYNRGYSLNYALTGEWKYDPVSSVEFNAYVNLRNENSMRSKLVRAPLHVLPSGDTISSYVGKVETRGNEWTIGGRLEHQQLYCMDHLLHQVLVGGEVEYDANTGEGVLVDTLYNYYGIESGRTSYSFDRIPGQLIASLYAEDKVTGNIGVDFSWVIGARYEMYHPTGFNLKGLWGKADFVQARHGSYLNPRSSLVLYLGKGSQARISGGLVSKSPPMSMVYSPPDVFAWRNPVRGVVQHFRYDNWVERLRAYREQQIEIGVDQTVSDLVGISMSAYHKYRYNQPGETLTPVFAFDTTGGIRKAWYVDERSQYANVSWNISRGVELTLRSKRIDALNLDVSITGAYSFTRSGWSATSYDELPDSNKGRYANLRPTGIPFDTLIGFQYPRSGEWRDNILLNYYIRYTVPSLGLWATLRVEHLLWKRYQRTTLEPVDYHRLSPAALADRQFDERINPQPAKFLINLNISKSLFKGAEVSFYVNNLMDDPGIYRSQLSSDPNDYVESTRNPDLFYGIEFSVSIDALWR